MQHAILITNDLNFSALGPMGVQKFLRIFVLTGLFVSARLRTRNITDLLKRRYGDEYIDPEGPLNIMRGHPYVNNGMIAKQRKFAAPMRLGYSCTGDASKGDCSYARNAHEDRVRELPGDSEAMVYLSEHYRILKTMFTVENGVVVVDKGPQAPFWNLFESRSAICLELFAALLLLAGGADIGLESGSLVAYDAVTTSHVLDLGAADGATLAVVEFFVKYGGVRATQVAGYGLHYSESPSFLIQAYICEFFEGTEDVMDVICIFEAAKEIVAMLPAGDSGAQQRPRFFTANYARAYSAIYKALSYTEMVFSGAQLVLLSRWPKLNHGGYTDRYDSKGVVSALLKVYYCLCSNPVGGYYDAALLSRSKSKLQHVLSGLLEAAFSALEYSDSAGSVSSSKLKALDKAHANFLEVAKAKAPASKTIADCFSEDISAGLATDPKNFLVVLAWVLGESEEQLRSLQLLLNTALGSNGSASDCRRISDRVVQMLGQFSDKTFNVHFDVCTASGGARYGTLRLHVRLGCEKATYEHDLKLGFKPAGVEVVYVSQQTTLKTMRRDGVSALLEELDSARSPALSAAEHAELDKLNDSPLRALILESIRRCLDPASHQAVSDRHIEAMYAAKNPLACHIATSHWMAHQPMESQKEVVKAGDQLLTVFEKLLVRSIKRRDSERHALSAGSPVVAVLDNILSSAAAMDTALRPFIVGALRRCVNERTDLFPSVFLLTDDASTCSMQELNESAYDGFIAGLAGYDISPEMLLCHAEQRARGKIQAASNAHGPWNGDVCTAVERCFRFSHEKSIRSLGGDTPDVSYYRYSICTLMVVAARPAVYCAMLRRICARRNDMPSLFKVYAVLQMAFPKLPRLGSISPELVAKVFFCDLTAEQIRSLLSIFAVFAHTEDDYCGVCSVFHHYRGLLRPEHAREFVELLRGRYDVYKSTLYAISLYYPRSPVKVMRTQPPYSAINDLLDDCLKSGFDVKTISQRVHDLPRN
ncbi:hypothetical protein PAPHI01_1283 [Pancytospora philotis]|nr:hypothetical protein PAPHI01_1283 [Pancytospora philotis]